MILSRTISTAAGNFFGPIPDKYRRHFVLILLAIGILFVVANPMAWAQTTVRISGQIFDASDGHPVGMAEIRVQGTEFTAYSDQSGRFALENVPGGQYRLEVNASGYESEVSQTVSVVPEITQRITVRLNRKVYVLDDREVRGRTTPLYISDIEIIDRSQIEKSKAQNLAEVLNTMEGVFVQESGTVGGKKQISIRGSAPKHVLVLLDGRRLNPSGSGEADLGSIPLEIVEKVEVYRGGQSARFGSDAIGGVVNIITRIGQSGGRPEMTASKYWGKWKTDIHNISLTNPIRTEKLTTKFTYGYRGTESDFAYDYSVLPRPDIERVYSGTRLNADFESHNYYVSGDYQANKKTELYFSGQYYQAAQGLPGKASLPDLTARKDDKRLLGSLRLEHDFSEHHQMEMNLGFTRLTQEFNNKDGSIPYASRHINDIAGWQATNNYRMWTGNEASGGIILQRDILYHDEFLNPNQSMGRTVRDNVGVFVSDRQTVDLEHVPLLDIAAVDVSVRWDNTDTKKDTDSGGVHHVSQWTQKVGASISRGERVKLTLRGSYGTSYRLPSINALFWKSDVRSQGNPDLRPEQSEHSDAGIEFAVDGPVNISAGVTYFHSYVKDVIVWRPSSPLGIWEPVNVDAAQITGHEDYIRVGILDDKLRFTYGNTVANPLNKARGSTFYNNSLTFRPHYVTNLGCELRLWKFNGSYQVRMVDIRYALEANTKWYGAYRVDNADFGFETDVGHFMVEAGYRVKNLHDEKYELIAHYPMPGREWGVNLSLSYRLK